MNAYLIAFLTALEEALPPTPGTRHVLHVDRGAFLCIALSGRLPVYVEDGDLGKPVGELVAEIAEIARRARIIDAEAA